jgi:hypothetical protein
MAWICSVKTLQTAIVIGIAIVSRQGADPAWAENDRGNGTDRGVLRGMRLAIEQAA